VYLVRSTCFTLHKRLASQKRTEIFYEIVEAHIIYSTAHTLQVCVL
jgi:hypothetical protein